MNHKNLKSFLVLIILNISAFGQQTKIYTEDVSSYQSGIELFEKQGSVPMRPADPNEGTAYHGWFQIAFASRDVATDYTRVVAAGATEIKPPFIAPDGKTMVAFVADPDGNLIELIERAG